jgi:hypothetical protein
MALEHDKALQRVILDLLKDDIEVYKQFVSRMNLSSVSSRIWFSI